MNTFLDNKNNYLKKIDEVILNGKYKDDWNTVMNHKVPDWYQNAKFGIFFHWGVYTVPAFGSEWYSCFMYKPTAVQRGKNIYEHHVKNYGDPKDFGYRDFVPNFKAEKFNADEWVEIIKNSGAKFVMPVAEHCDGFAMYDTEFSDWSASKKGPCKDTLMLLKQSIENNGMTFCVSSHRMEHYWFMGALNDIESDIPKPLEYGDIYWPAKPQQFDMEDGSTTKSYTEVYLKNIDEDFMEDWLVRTCELVDKYQPKIIYFDWWIQIKPMKPYLKKFMAYYYNRALEWGEEVTVNYKNDAFPHTSAVKDIERGQLTDVSPYFWQNDTSVAKNSWCYTDDNDYKESPEIISTLIDVVSKNGSLLLNICPKSDGTIPEKDKQLLAEIGEWMKVNGEGIYDTVPFRKYGEGPTLTEEGHFSDTLNKPYTEEDFRFTYKGSTLYVFAMNYPADGVVRVKTLAGAGKRNNNFNAVIKNVEVLGQGKRDFIISEDYLTVFGDKIKTDKPVCIKFEIE